VNSCRNWSYFLDGHHLPLEYGENLRQRHRADLHAAQRKLLARDPPREIVHQFLFAQGKSLDDPRLLPLKRFALEHLRNPPPQKIDPRFHFLLESVRQASRQSQQPRPVGILEIVHVAAVRRGLGLRMQVLDHPHDHPAAAGAR
jgi:hypothetical protein